LVEPTTLISEAISQRGYAQVLLLSEPGASYSYSKRQESAQGHEPFSGRLLDRNPTGAEDSGEQIKRLLLAKNVEHDGVRAFQTVKAPPTSDDHCTRRCARQQRTHLSWAVSVIQHDEHPPVGGQRPKQLRSIIHGIRD